MQLYLHVNTQKRRLVESAGNNQPKDMPALFREDQVRIHLWLANETGDFTNPLSEIVNLHSIAVEAAIGLPDQPPEALVTNWGQVAAHDLAFQEYLTANGITYVDGTYVPPGMQSKALQADLDLNTTELVNAFANASGDTLERVFEIEVTDGGRRHTVLQVPVVLHKDIITHANQAPSAVTAGSAFANSFAATATDSETIEWQQTGDYNAAHIKGLNGATLTAGQHLAVNSTADGFELVTAASGSGGASVIDDLTDVDTSSAGHTPTDGQSLVWDASMSHWMPQTITGGSGGASAIDDLTDVDTTTASPTTGQILTWDGTNWTPSAAPTGSGATGPAGADGQGWTSGAYDSATGTVTFASNDGLGFSTSDLRSPAWAALAHSSTPSASGTINLDFDGDPLHTLDAISGSCSIGALNMGTGKRHVCRLVCGSSDQALTFDPSWNWISQMPASIGASEVCILSLTAFGANASDVVAAFAPVSNPASGGGGIP